MKLPTEQEEQKIVEEFLGKHGPKQYASVASYMRFYRNCVCPSQNSDAIVPIDSPIFTTHDDVCVFARNLKAGLKQTQHDLTSGLKVGAASDKDAKEALWTIVRVTFMLNCASKQTYPAGFAVGDFIPTMWGDDERFIDFITKAFPPHSHKPSQCQKILSAQAQRKHLKAWKLRKRYKIIIHPTDDITEHLLYHNRVLSVFHHTGWLKAQLHRSLAMPIDMNFEESLKLGTLPPQLVLETLDSIQYLLFPLATDLKSAKLLSKMVREKAFDPDVNLVEGHIREIPNNFLYKYWGPRLLRLLEIVDNPPPANKLIAWFERHTSERNALTIAILGLFLSALLGFLGLLIGAISLAFTILQYKAALAALSATQR